MSTLTVADAQRVPELAGVDSTLLQLAIDDIEAEIVDRFGAYGVGAITERIDLRSSSSTIVLRRKPAEVTSISEWDGVTVSPATELDPDDYQVRGFLVERLRSGPNPRFGWSLYGVEVVYVPEDDTARRKMATIDVLKAELVGYTGTGLVRIGDYTRQAAGVGSASSSVTVDRAKILARLRPKRMVLR